MLIRKEKIHDEEHLKIDFSQPWVAVNPDKPLPSSSTTESLPISSSFSSDEQKEIPLQLFLDQVEQRRQKCVLIFGHREGSDLTEEKSFGLGASKTAAGCYQIPIDSIAKTGPSEWVEFVITYDNKFILNNIDSETITEEKQHQLLDFNHQMIGDGTFLKAAGRIKIENNGHIFISPFSKYFQLGMDYTPIILFVLKEMGISILSENIFIADEQGNNLLFPETRPVNKANKDQINKSIVNFYSDNNFSDTNVCNNFSLAKVIAKEKELKVEKELSDLFFSIDDAILSSKNKKNIIELTDKNLHSNLKMAVVDLLLSLIRKDFSNSPVKFTEQTIESNLSEIYKNCELIKSKFGISIQEEALKIINSNFRIINDLLQNEKASKNKDNVKEIIRICNGFLSFTINTNGQNAQSDLNVNMKKVSKVTISEKLSAIMKNIQSINLPPNEKYNNRNLKDIIINAICKNLFAINESILLTKNHDNISLKEILGRDISQYFEKINEYIHLINDAYDIDLSFVKHERYNWLFYISKLKFQIADNLNKVDEPANRVASQTLSEIESKLKKFKAGFLPQRDIDEQAINSPFLKFYSKNPFQTCLALLYDYTKSGPIERFFKFAWNRHYTKAVENFFSGYEKYAYPDDLSIDDICQIVLGIGGNGFADYTGKKGTLYQRLAYCINLERKSALDFTRTGSNDSVVNQTPSTQQGSSQSVQLTTDGSVVNRIPAAQDPSQTVQPVPFDQRPSAPILSKSVTSERLSSIPIPNGSVPSASSSPKYVFGPGMYNNSNKLVRGETIVPPTSTESKPAAEPEEESSLRL